MGIRIVSRVIIGLLAQFGTSEHSPSLSVLLLEHELQCESIGLYSCFPALTWDNGLY